MRPVYAGNAMCTVSTSDMIKLITIRGTNFEKATQSDPTEYATEAIGGIEEIMSTM